MMRPSNALPVVYLCREPVDFRKGINGLAILVEEVLGEDPFSEHLFDEAEQDADPALVNDELAGEVPIPAHQRKKRGSKPLPEALPRVEVIHEISVDELHCIQMDETRVQVLKEPDKKAQSKSYLWLQRGGPPDQPVVLYDYDPSRSQQQAPYIYTV